MSITWIIILSLFGFIVLILGTKILFSFFAKKNEKPTTSNQPTNNDFSYESNFLILEAILNINRELQSNQKTNIARLNEYFKQQLLALMARPEYIFNLHLWEINEYLNDFIQNKLLKNSASMWDKKFVKEIAMLQIKNQEWIKVNQDLKKYLLTKETEILKGWENGDGNH